jgi:hypothetical protein
VQLYLADAARNNASTVAVVKQWEEQLTAPEEMLDTQQLTLQRLKLHVPFMKNLFKACIVDTAINVAPIAKKPRDEKQRWVESKGLPWIYDGKPIQVSRTQPSVQHKGNKGKTALRLPPTAIIANGYDVIEALPEMERRVQWQKLVGKIGTYANVTQHSLSLLLARVTPNAEVPKNKASAWARVHEAVGLLAPTLPVAKQSGRAVKAEVKIESESKIKSDVDSKSESKDSDSKAKVAGGGVKKLPASPGVGSVNEKRSMANVEVEEIQPLKKSRNDVETVSKDVVVAAMVANRPPVSRVNSGKKQTSSKKKADVAV